MAARRKVAVLGGGVIGVSTAQQLVRAGADVVLVTEGELVSGASGRSLSWLNSAGVRSDAYHRLRMAGIDRYRTLAAQRPGLGWLRFDGGLAWQAEDNADVLSRNQEHEFGHGYDSRLLTPAEVAEYVPGVDPAAIPSVGAIWNPGEGWVDLPSLVEFLIDDFLRRGGDLMTDAGPATVDVGNGAVSGVRTARGDILRADAAVIATGSAVPAMVAALGFSIPDATPLAMLVTTKRFSYRLTAVLNTPRASLRPTPSRALAVDSDWSSSQVASLPDGSYAAPSATIEALLDEASRLLEGNPRLEVARIGIGSKPVPKDGEPVLGRLGDIDGLYVAFTHSGATLALIAGELLAFEVLTGDAHPLLRTFRPQRFG